MTPTLWLSCHVHYACRHSGVCCTAGWPLPVEDVVVPAIEAAMAHGRLTTRDGRAAWLLESAEAPMGMAGTLRQPDGACVFHRPRAGVSGGASHECAVHGTLGHEALPSTCQHFPRIALIDDRGVRVSLSHVCPTALDLLLSHDGPVAIVSGPAAVPGRDVPEGLDARDELPPALTDRVLMDLDTLTQWEAHVVGMLAGAAPMAGSVDTVVAALVGQADALAAWRPGQTSLATAAGELLARAPVVAEATDAGLSDEAVAVHARVLASCRAPWTHPPAPDDIQALDARWVTPAWPAMAPLVRRYLAARAFGAWAQYQADGLAGSARWLGTVLAVVRVEAARAAASSRHPLDRERLGEAIRQADLLLLHYADPAEAARAFDASVHRRT